MKGYEFTVILSVDDELTDKGLTFINDEFAKNNVNIIKQEDLGVKLLAYPIKKQDKGHYVYFEIEAEPNCINSINNEFLLHGSILKFLFVSK